MIICLAFNKIVANPVAGHEITKKEIVIFLFINFFLHKI